MSNNRFIAACDPDTIRELLAERDALAAEAEALEALLGQHCSQNICSYKVKTGLGDLYLTVNEIDGRPFEVFATIGRSGRSITAKAEAIGRLVSLALRSGIHVREIVKQLKGIGGEHPVFQKKGMLLSIPDAVAWVLAQHYLGEENIPSSATSLVKPICPDCGRELTFQEGCFLCAACGFTRCG